MNWIVIGFAVVALALYITSFVMASNSLKGTDDWNVIKNQLTKIWIITISGSFALFLATTMYYKESQSRDYFMYFVLAIACMSFGLSYCALVISAISR